MSTAAFTTGASRTAPPKPMFAVPSFTGTPLGFQLLAVVQLLFAPPPSQSCARAWLERAVPAISARIDGNRVLTAFLRKVTAFRGFRTATGAKKGGPHCTCAPQIG